MKDMFTTLVNGILEIVKSYKGDWKENNPSSPNYIKNRTHWIDEEKINEIVLNETIFIQSYDAMFNTELLLNMDKTYYVTLNGVEYVCKPWKGYEDCVCIGNGDIYGGQGMGNLDYPFSCDSYIQGEIYLNVNSGDEGEYHVVIREEGIIETIHTLDEKYLPPMDSDFDKIVDSECLVIVDGGYMDADGYVGTYPSPKVNDRIVLTVGDLTFEGVIRPTDDQYDIVVGNGTLNSERGDGISNGEDFFIHFSAWGESSITRVWFSNDVDIDYYAPVKILAYTDRIKNNLLSDLVGKRVYNHGNEIYPGEIFNDYQYNIAGGISSHAEGEQTQAMGRASHSEGLLTRADYVAHSEGQGTYAEGDSSHAEGFNTKASGKYSHSEGYLTKAIGRESHSQGNDTTALGQSSHAEGISSYNATSEVNSISTSTPNSTIYNSWNIHKFTLAKGIASHVEGRNCMALTDYSHAEGNCTVTIGNYSHSEGYQTHTYGVGSHAEGFSSSIANALSYNNEQEIVSAWGNDKFALACGKASHSEGLDCLALGVSSHAEGRETSARGECSHTEGDSTHATGYVSHAEGYNTYADGSYSHAEGNNCHAVGNSSHAEGCYNYAYGNYSHVEGEGNTANSEHSHAEGHNTFAGSKCQHVQGKNNIKDNNNKYAHIVGNGSGVADELRSNAHTLDWNGNGWYQGNLYVGGTNQDDGNKVLSTADINFDSDGNLTITINGVTKKFAPIG